jgi:hypothetical protein
MTIVLAIPGVAWAQGKSLKEQLPLEARGHWDAAVALATRAQQQNDQKAWASARTSFYEAYKISNNPRVLFNVAVCEKNVGQYNKAYQTIQKELDDGKAATPPLSAGEVKEASDFQKGLEKFIAKVNIDVDPKDADVFMNDDKVDLSKPGPYLAAGGEIRIRATKAGYAEAVQKLDVAGGTTGTATLKLQPLERTAVVSVAVIGPQRATVKVDNQEVGFALPNQPFQGPVKVQDTPHQISVEAPGYATGVQTVIVKEGPPIYLTLQLAPEQSKGKLIVDAKPEGATILIDGHAVGATKWEGPVDAKVHQVSVKKPGFYTWNYEVDVPKGGERAVSASLNEDRNTSFVPWLIGTIVVGSAVIVGIVLLATPPDEKPRNGTLDPFTVSTQHHRSPGGFSPSGAGFSF